MIISAECWWIWGLSKLWFLGKKCLFIPVRIKAAVCCKEQPLYSLFSLLFFLLFLSLDEVTPLRCEEMDNVCRVCRCRLVS